MYLTRQRKSIRRAFCCIIFVDIYFHIEFVIKKIVKDKKFCNLYNWNHTNIPHHSINANESRYNSVGFTWGLQKSFGQSSNVGFFLSLILCDQFSAKLFITIGITKGLEIRVETVYVICMWTDFKCMFIYLCKFKYRHRFFHR